MLLRSKKQGAENAPLRSLDENTKTERHYSLALSGLQELRDIAWHYAMKYRWDPALGRAHEEYLTLLNGILKECEG